MDKNKSDFHSTFTYIPASEEEAEQIANGLRGHSNFKSSHKLLKSNNKIITYFVSIFLAFVFFTVATLPVTFIAQLFGFCLVPVQAPNMECPKDLNFITNSIGLGVVASFFASISPIISFLNKPIKI